MIALTPKRIVRITLLCCLGSLSSQASIEPASIISDGRDAIYVGAHGESKVFRISRSRTEIQDVMPTVHPPHAIILSLDQKQLLVASGAADGRIDQIDLKTKEVLQTFEVGHTPSALAISSKHKKLLVANRFENSVSIIDLENGEQTRIEVKREPMAIVISSDEAYAFVANYLPEGSSTEHPVSAKISVIDLATSRVIQNIALPDGSNALHTMIADPENEWLLIPHVVGRYHLPTTQLERGWMNTAALSIIDMNELEHVATVMLDDVERGFANPWAIALSPDRKQLCITGAGVNELSLIDYTAFQAKLREHLSLGINPDNDLGFMQDIRHRIPLQGQGPRTVLLDDDSAWVGQYFSDTVERRTLVGELISILPLGPAPQPDLVRQGEILFYSAEDCFQNWQSCSSCHPSSRVDGLNWDLLNDGVGNPKNTRSLLYSHQTPPVMSRGVRKDAETAVRAGIKHIKFAKLDETKANELDAYIKSMRPLESPFLEKGRPSASAIEGKRLFNELSCVKCHSGDYFTDGELHDLGTGRGIDKDQPFDVPTLIEVWRTAPYLHDGRAATLEEAIIQHIDIEKKISTSGKEDPDDLDDVLSALVEYLKTF